MRQPLTTRGRLVLFSTAILAAALVIADAAVLGSLLLIETSQSDAVLVTQARLLDATLEDVNGQTELHQPIPGETQGGIAVDAALVAAGGRVLAQTEIQPLPAATLQDLAARTLAGGGPVFADVVDSRGVPRRAYATVLTSGGSNSVLVVSRSVSEMRGTLERTLLLLLGVSAVLLGVGGGLGYALAGRVLRPVRTIAGLARSISERDLHRRVAVRVPADELGELVDTFNAMLARLEASFESRRRFTADASHELRAPLTLMRSEVEGALARSRGRDEYRRVLTGLLGEIEHLGRMADQLLMLARADAGALTPSLEEIDVADFLHEVGARWETAAAARGVRIRVAAPAAGGLRGDPSLLRRVLDNLLDNAVRHAPAGSEVALRGGASPGGWTLEVADRGPGIPEERRSGLFSRFGRTDPARTRGEGGAGLGLALSAAVARAHGGALDLVAGAGPGATFRLRLPG